MDTFSSREGTVWPGRGATVEVSRGVGVVITLMAAVDDLVAVTPLGEDVDVIGFGRRAFN